MDDLIYRRQAIDALDGELTITGRTNAEAVRGYVKLVKDRLERLPSAQLDIDVPDTNVGKWIPCSERLPEDEYVLISKKPTKLSVSKWSVAIAIRTADPRSRKIQWRDSGFGVIQDDKVLAWMPLPEPYAERREE